MSKQIIKVRRVSKPERDLWNRFGKDYLNVQMFVTSRHRIKTMSLKDRQDVIVRQMTQKYSLADVIVLPKKKKQELLDFITSTLTNHDTK